MTLAVRPPTEGDAGAVVALGNAFDTALLGEDESTEADVRDRWRDLGDLGRDAWLVARGTALAGYATLRNGGGGRLEAEGYVHPDHFGRGVGRRLIELTEARAGELAAAADPPVVLRNTVLHADASARALLEGRGYVPINHHLRMRMNLDSRPPAPEWPVGVVTAPFRPGVDNAEVYACVEEAFAYEWRDQAEWSARRFADPRFDPSLWIVAREGGEVCGVALSTHGQFDMGFVNTLAVRDRWRRRGLGFALLRSALGLFWDRGERRVGLGVDSDSPTGARRLYERAGMHVAWQADVYERPLEALTRRR